MPRTSLFPRTANKWVSIKQGTVGDCYLLASLDCILSTQEGYQKLESLFTETDNGVTLRIKRSQHSTYLRPQKMTGKYDYHFDKARNEDVFIISNARLKEIDEAPNGARTNSLAVKVLERISAYYFRADWDPAPLHASMKAHDDLRDRYSGTAPTFVGNLLGVETEDKKPIDEIIRLKSIYSDLPVYVHIDYGQPDQNGKIHNCHALRVDKLIPNLSGGYDFLLANPWDNSRREIFTLDEITKRRYHCCVFKTSPEKYELAKLLLNFPKDWGLEILSNTKLTKLMVEVKQYTCRAQKSPVGFAIEQCFNLYRALPIICEVYSKVSSEHQAKILEIINLAAGNRERFLQAFLRDIPRDDVAVSLLSSAAKIQPPCSMTTQSALYRAVSTNSLELYQELVSPEVDLISQLSLFKLERNVHFRAFVNFEAQFSSIDVARLQKIIRYFGPSKSSSDYSFDEHALFELVFSCAISETAQAKKISLTRAGDDIRSALLHYYLSSDKNVLKPYPSLHTLFSAPDYSPVLLERTLDSQGFMIAMVAQVINSASYPDYLNNRLRSIHLSHSSILADIIQQSAAKKPRDLYIGLHRLSKINPSLANALYQYSKATLPAYFSVTFDAFCLEIQQEIPSPFSTWFIDTRTALVSDSEVTRAEDTVSAYITNIQLFSVSFSGIVDSVEDYRDERIREFKALYESKQDLLIAKSLLTSNPILKAFEREIEHKISELYQAAEDQIRMLALARAQIATIVKTIGLFEVYFHNCYSLQDIHSHQNVLKNTINCYIENNPQLREAQASLGLENELHPAVMSALTAKLREIDTACRARKESLTAAEATIHSVECNIQTFPVTFQLFKNESDINSYCSHLLEELYRLTEKDQTQLQKSALIFGFKNQLPPRITLALECKAQEIITLAEKRLLQVQAENTLNQYRERIAEVVFNLKDITSLTQLRNHEFELINRLRGIEHDPDLHEALNVLNQSDTYLNEIIQSQIDSIRQTSKRQEVAFLKQEAEAILADMKFDHYLAIIDEQTKILEVKARNKIKYEKSASKARMLYFNLLEAKRQFLDSDEPLNLRLEQFKTNALRAIDTAKSTLGSHLHWKQILADIASAILTVASCFITYFVTGRFRLFTVPNEFTKPVLEMEKVLNPMQVGA
ncbi:hypothetical protein [Legionella impletisoli]|uniref:Ninein n=1 Tax=Legionella impletisoli TaxID=343510 RepID=A0A917JZ76_9GAMM|nr:hypothetical protein [Legionella impletisoli]GGI93334.1 hypothetical protein GCM10007966_22380 [Legionella impletisoli]